MLPVLGWAQTVSFSKQFVKLESGAPNIASVNDTVTCNFLSFNSSPKLVTTAPFEISVDGINYDDTIIVQSLVNNVPIYIRSIFAGPDLSARAEIKVLDNNFILSDRIHLLGSSISSSQSISMLTWNIKWFGLSSKCFCDTAVARANVTQILSELDADIFALQEIANADMLQQVVNNLGTKYDYVISDYCSQIQSPSVSGYATCQKLAFIYNKNKLDNVGQYGLLKSTFPTQSGTSSPYYYFASGRWPYTISFVPKNTSDTLRLVNIHGKAFAGSSEHNRRAGGALKMTDSLNAVYPNKKIVVLGDYNDKLEGANTQGFSLSPYDYMLTNGFVGITKPSLFPGQSTYAGSGNSIIDNYVFSNAASNDYIPNSTFILEELDDAIFDYRNSTTDHYPVLSHIRINAITEIVDYKKESNFKIVQPNGKRLFLKIENDENKEVSVSVYSMLGQLVFNKSYHSESQIKENLDFLNSGMYVVSVRIGSQFATQKWLVN